VAQQLDFSHIPTYVLIDGTQDPATTAPGITPAIAQLADFLKLDYQDTFVVDTSIVQRPQDYPTTLAPFQQQLQGVPYD
jgi:hypothetical protein